MTSKRTDQAFFERDTLTALEAWSDHDLEAAGRLTHPMRWDPDSDRYTPVSWHIAFQEIARELQAFEPHEAVFYTSGRASLETSCMFQLFARVYGSNHLPDSSPGGSGRRGAQHGVLPFSLGACRSSRHRMR